MATKIIKAQMKQRRDTLANWAAVNPVLLDGELGIVSDDPNLYKIGDGTTPWDELPFRGFDGTIAHTTGDSRNAVMSQAAVTEALKGAGNFNPSGTYPDLVAGDLAGRGESVPAEFTFRASGGKSIKDGRAYLKAIKGNSVVWNNMVDTRGYEGQLFITTGIRIVKGHKYLLYRTETNQALYLIPTVNGAENYEMSIHEGEHSGIFQAQYSDDNGQGTVYSEAYCGACIISDLTKMFGAGNEPTTIEEYEARKPIVEDEYAYNAGEVIHMTAEGIKSIGDNAWDEQWRQGFYYEGEYISKDTQICSKNPIRVLPNESYCITQEQYYVWYDDKEMQFIGFDVKFVVNSGYVINITEDSLIFIINLTYSRK